ncbi:hypothetical protein C0Q70_08485 [Pomacea canaliculata]|uniref:NIPSNAP domain-containing protein n=1 Tax=Pomacea canaliculata TaxID=400727 RepID=A0A2T7PI04_POMCA|nr:hypothetical protein C0Q70_08485 [Pomacea canaliculata]
MKTLFQDNENDMGFDLRVLNTVMAAMAGLSRGMFRTINLLPASKGFPGLAASSGRFSELIEMKQTGAELVGSWTVEIGDQDEAIHVWSYKGGYPVLNRANQIYRTDKDFIDFRKNRNKMIRYRKNQILLAFSFWPELKPRDPSNIYELRSYTLKPGTMIEWGNNWARGIKSRTTNNEPVAGFFSQMGDLYTVHHFWGYDIYHILTQIWSLANASHSSHAVTHFDSNSILTPQLELYSLYVNIGPHPSRKS